MSVSKTKLRFAYSDAIFTFFLVTLLSSSSDALIQGEGEQIDEDTVVTVASDASDAELQELHHRSKRQVMFYPPQQAQVLPLGQTQQYQYVPQQQQQQQQQRYIYPQQQQQQQQPQQRYIWSQPVHHPIVQQQQQQQPAPQQRPVQQSQRFGRSHNNEIPQTPAPSDDACTTKRGDRGTCTTLAECYPYITINNQPTIDLLMRISTACSSDSAPNVILTQQFGSMPHHQQQQQQSRPQQPQASFLQKSQTTICCPGGPPLKKQQPSVQPQPQAPQQQQPQQPQRPTYPPTQTQRPAPPPSWHPPKNTVQPDGRRWDKSMLPPYLQNLVPPNSTPVPIQKYPWTVAIMMGERHHCGGSLLTPRTVITAAHCVHMLDSHAVANLRVLLGHHDISSGARREAVTRGVIKSIYHSGFSMRTLHNDIALLILDQPVSTESAKISTVRLCNEPISSGTVTIAGWGQMGWNLPATPMLMETTIDIWNNRKCAAVYGALAPGGITQNMICGTAVGKDACRGDSGGPLMMKRAHGEYEQIGVVSWGIECGRYPSVHTRMTSFMPWIQKNRVD